MKPSRKISQLCFCDCVLNFVTLQDNEKNVDFQICCFECE